MFRHISPLTWLVVLGMLLNSRGAIAQGPAQPAGPGSAFTYQGQLTGPNGPVDATCSMTFRLFDGPSAGAQVGSDLNASVAVSNGLFVTALDFGSNAFEGSARWLEVTVLCPGDAVSTTLLPRQPITPAPYAMYASAAPWSGLTGLPAGFADGTDNDTQYSTAPGGGLALSGMALSVDTSVIQRRVNDSCGAGTSIRSIAADGSVICETDNDTTYSNGAGLSLNGTTFSVDTSATQARVTGTCAGGSSVQTIGANGGVTCLAHAHRPAAPAPNIVNRSTGGGTPSITIGADGLPILSYRLGFNPTLEVTHCGDTACTSGNVTHTVDGAGTVGLDSAITIGADGLPIISYHGETTADLKVAHCGNLACSSGNTITTVDSTGDVGLNTSITIGADGLPVISYRDNTNGRLKVAHCGDLACSGGNTLTTVDFMGIAGSSIALGVDGLPVISYYNHLAPGLSVVHCGDPACSSGNTITVADTSTSAGGGSSITIGVDGLPIVSYRENTGSDLKVVHCGDVACSSGNTITTVDGPTTVSFNTSITIGADGLPIVSYYDQANFDLRVAHCGNLACSSGNTLITVDGPGNVGTLSSITIGVDGLPIIAYQGGVAQCSNPLCVPYFRRR